MRILIAFLLLPISFAFANGPLQLAKSESPDGRYALALANDPNDEEGKVLLIDPKTNRALSILEGVNSEGGTWGKPESNVHCQWSKDGSILVVNYRSGRLMQSSEIFRISANKAAPIELPEIKDDPRGAVLQAVEWSVNPGTEITLSPEGTIIQRIWGMMPKADVDYSRFGLKSFEDCLRFHYRFTEKGTLTLTLVEPCQ